MTAANAPDVVARRGLRKLLTQAEVREWLGLSDEYLANARARTVDPMPYLRCSAKRYRYDADAVLRWLERQSERARQQGRRKAK